MQDRIHRTRSIDSLVQRHAVHALRVKIDDEMFKPLVHCRRDTRTDGRVWWSHRYSCPLGLFSDSGTMHQLCTRQLTLHPFQDPAQSSNAVARTSLHHVPDLALKPAGPRLRFIPGVFWSSVGVSWTQAVERSPKIGGPSCANCTAECPSLTPKLTLEMGLWICDARECSMVSTIFKPLLAQVFCFANQLACVSRCGSSLDQGVCFLSIGVSTGTRAARARSQVHLPHRDLSRT